MMLRIIHGKLKPGTWEAYEREHFNSDLPVGQRLKTPKPNYGLACEMAKLRHGKIRDFDRKSLAPQFGEVCLN